MIKEDNSKAQELAADKFLEDYDFGEDYPVTDMMSGWNKDNQYWSKWVYGDTPEGTRWAGSFGVEFETPESSQIINNWLEVA